LFSVLSFLFQVFHSIVSYQTIFSQYQVTLFTFLNVSTFRVYVSNTLLKMVLE